VRNEYPDQVLRRFHTLFILGQGYPDRSVGESLEQVLAAKGSVETLLPFLNRCCYILVNHWQMNPTEKLAVGKLVKMLQQVQMPGTARQYDITKKRMRQMVWQYINSENFQQLNRIAEFIRDRSEISQQTPLVSLIGRYPYLYSHCLKGEDENPSRLRLIRHAQSKAQQKYESDLSKYIALTAVSQERSSRAPQGAIKNPTLLTPKDLHISLKHYVGRSTCMGTYREMSDSFIRAADQELRFQHFKDNIYDYLTADVNPNYANRKFNHNLRQHLNAISPEHHHRPTTEILRTRTYNQALNYLVIQSRQKPKHFVFMDLISNIGTTRTIGMLLKLVLLQHSVKDSLERRLSVLFQHYESHQQSGIQWLVRCLEKVNLAFTTHFGQLNVSYLTAL
ncbi:MAG: hypothetical protein AAGB01_10765, partial [Cyanobacteria bacterium P01_F01_bin.42]